MSIGLQQIIWDTTWSIFALGGGIWVLFWTRTFLEKNSKLFLRMHKKTGLSIFKKQSEEITQPYMLFFGKAMALVFIVTAISLLWKHHQHLAQW